MNRQHISKLLVWCLALMPVVGVLGWVAPVAQDPAYHAFADTRAWAGVPNAADVLSNVPFLLVGVAGLIVLYGRHAPVFMVPAERRAFVVFFAGLLLVAGGSGWYHLAPDNTRLVWDRLPMTLAFMGITAAIISEHVDSRLGGRLLPLLLLAGIASVWWWAWTEAQGHGDLRPYGLVQFYPFVLIVALLIARPSRYTRSHDYWVVMGWYVLAKIFEYLDAPVFDATGWVSGHTLKHLAGAMAGLWVLRMLVRRDLSAS